MKLPLQPFSLRFIALACALALALPGAWAEKADRGKPLNAESDSLRYDEVKQSSVFTGNVIITKGTIVIRADRIEVAQDREGFQLGTASSTGGKRAFFRQKRDSVGVSGDEWIEGEAQSIIYDSRADTVTFRGNANMRRLRGAVVTDETQGALITFDNTSEVFNVSGGSGATNSGAGGRVRAVLSPKAAASAPASGGATLRPSTTLGGEKK